MKGTSENKKYLIWFWSLFALPFIILIIIFILISREKLGPMPSFKELENPELNLAAQVFSEDEVLLGKIALENRTWTNFDELSPYLVNALIATEDIRYYRHSGIDIRGIVRAVVKTIILRQNTGGGSTISQQLAKQLYPRDTSHVSAFTRKIRLGVSKFKEWQTAVKLEKSYTKEEIIAMYLNIYDFNYQAIGIKSAARVYFNTTPDSLSIQEAAVMIGMLKASSRYNPVRNYDRVFQRRNTVLTQMAKYGYIEKHLADSVMKMPIELDFQIEDHNSGRATYLREYLRFLMTRPEPDPKRYMNPASYSDAVWLWESDPLYGWCAKNKKPDGSNYDIYKDGLRIFTTINSKMQQYAEESVAEHISQEIQPGFNRRAKSFRNPPYSNDLTRKQVDELIMRSLMQSDRYYSMRRKNAPEDSIILAFKTPVRMKLFSWKGEIDTVMTPLDSIRYYKYFIRAGFMVEDPKNGYIKAYVGGTDFRYFKYDACTSQRRQVGSTIKPFLYTIAMMNDYSPCYEVENIPRTFQVIMNGKDTTWTPRSSGNPKYHGKMVTLKWGLAQSENYISAWIMQRFSPEPVADLMHKMGVRSFIDPVVSIFLGTSDVKLEEMVGAYGTFANKGVYTKPMYVTRIEDKNGNVVSRFSSSIEEVLSEQTAFLMTNLLQGVVQSGSGNRLRREPYMLMNQIGGKTGTTQEQSDAWFMGITPNLVGGVWCGWEDRSIHFESLSEGQGANVALPILGRFLKKVYNDPEFGIMEADEFERPSGFNVDIDCEGVRRESTRRNNPTRDRY